MNKATYDCIARLKEAGVSEDDARALRRISMTLHRWHEMECGDSNDYASWVIARGRKVNGSGFEHDEKGKPYIERHIHSENKPRYEAIADREKGALARLAKIMARYPALGFYVQGDPRGAALYILRPGDVAEGQSVDSRYSRGLAVYK